MLIVREQMMVFFVFLGKMSRKHKFHNPAAAYFVSFATVFWIDTFTKQAYFSILEESLTYCRKEKGMVPIAIEIAYCFMPNHIHFTYRSTSFLHSS